MSRQLRAAVLAAVVAPVAGAALADSPTLSFYGVPGLIDMPSGEANTDGLFSLAGSYSANTTKVTLTFQLAPRISGTFRYSRFASLNMFGFEDYYDRSFDLRYTVIKEGQYLPSVTVGLQDFIGTGFLASEYIAATKSFGSKLKVTAGLGWGRLGSYGAIGSIGTRPEYDFSGKGGTANAKQWFRGDYAPFGGIEYTATDKLTFKLEYSSDAYVIESQAGLIDRNSPINFGVEYKVSDTTTLAASYLYGSTIGFTANFAFNPNQPRLVSAANAPLPIRPRTSQAASSWQTDWAASPVAGKALGERITKGLDVYGMTTDGIGVTGSSITVRLMNPRFDAEPMALGRALRVITAVIPNSVETITLLPIVNGIPASAITVRRSDLEQLENDPDASAEMLARTVFSDGTAPNRGATILEGAYPRYSWSVEPYYTNYYFDPRNPIQGEVGIKAGASLDLAPGFILSGSVAQALADNYETPRKSNSVLPHVRSDSPYYLQDGKGRINDLTAAYYFRPGEDLYGRVTVGYLERMYGGVSTELLWKPVTSNLALGVEMNWVKQRAFDGMFGFRDYSIATGHVSAYYSFGDGYIAEVDAGRYLAGDYGATVSLDREFASGWKVGAFATLTDVSADDFGEGSFDKGIRFEIPLSFFTGQPSRAKFGQTIRPVQRDGGARVSVGGRLYETVRPYHETGLSREWGLFWR